MAEVDTSIYKNVGAGNQPMTPAQVMQMIGGMNQIKLQNQEINARNGLAAAYARNPSPDLSTLGRMAGYQAGPAIQQQIQNNTAQFAAQNAWRNDLQSRFSSLGSLPNPTMADVLNLAVSAARNTNAPTQMIRDIVDGARQYANDPKGLKKYLIQQGLMASGTASLAGTAGPPNPETGQPENITKGEAILRQAGALPGQTGTGMVTAMQPGFELEAQQGAKQMAADRADAANFASDMFTLDELRSNLAKLGTTGTGPGTQELNEMKSFIRSNLSWLPGAHSIDLDKISTFDQAQKYATRLAVQFGNTIGPHTNEALSTALTGSPNTHISNLGAQDLTKAMIGLRRMKQAQILEADAQNIPAGRAYSKFAANFATKVDPRAFLYDTLTSQQFHYLQQSIKTPQERAKFNNSLQTAIKLGLIERPVPRSQAAGNAAGQ